MEKLRGIKSREVVSSFASWKGSPRSLFGPTMFEPFPDLDFFGKVDVLIGWLFDALPSKDALMIVVCT